jgi:cyclase
MNRRLFIQQGAMSFGALALAQQNILTSLFEDPWKITMLTKEAGIFTERGGTILFLVNKSSIVVVDSQFPEQAGHLIGELKKKSTQPIEVLINTHHHGDHTGGNIAFKGIAAHVLAHENSLKNQKASAAAQKSEDKQLFPDQTFSTVWRQKYGKENIALHYFGAGHTNGDAVIHFEKQNIAHMGDLVFNRRHPFVDRNAGANMKSWITVLDKTISTFDKKTKYVFGHSGTGYEVTGTTEDLKAFQDYLSKLLDFVGTQIKEGKSKDDVLKIKELPFETQWKGDGLNRPLQAAYEELTS